MKKQKKLTLSKETLRNLAEMESHKILGGGVTSLPNSGDTATCECSMNYPCTRICTYGVPC